MDLSNYNTEEPEKLFEVNRFKFLYDNCDNVTINGKTYNKTIENKLRKFAMTLPDRDGKPNIKTVEFDYKIGGIDFDEVDFIKYEIENLDKQFDKVFNALSRDYSRTLNGTPPNLYLPKRKEIYLNYLQKKLSEHTQPKENTEIIPNKNPYPNIFTDDGFLLWERLFEEFNLNEKSQTDIKFCFDKMKNDKYIYNTVKQADFLRWLNDLKNWNVQKPNSTVNLKDSKRLSVYNLSLESIWDKNAPKKVQSAH